MFTQQISALLSDSVFPHLWNGYRAPNPRTNDHADAGDGDGDGDGDNDGDDDSI